MDSSEPTTVCVTGASGYIASWIIKLLLESKRRYAVRGTVRGDPEAEKYAWLRDLDPEGGRLQLYQADLLDEGSFERAFAGCDVVMHTASPFVLNVKDPQQELVDPALNGTNNAAAGSVSRVVLTSSVAAVTDQPEEGHVYTEKDWNELSSLKRNPYYYSKKLAEEAAWKFVEREDGTPPPFSLVVINPFMVIGPTVPASPNSPSGGIVKSILTGGYPGIMAFAWSFVDVRDVARAHILASEIPEASGRYIVANEAMWMKDVVALFKENGYKDFDLPSKNLACGLGTKLLKFGSQFGDKGTASYIKTNLGRYPQLSNKKAQEELGLDFLPVTQSLLDSAKDLVDKGHVDRPGI